RALLVLPALLLPFGICCLPPPAAFPLGSWGGGGERGGRGGGGRGAGGWGRFAQFPAPLGRSPAVGVTRLCRVRVRVGWSRSSPRPWGSGVAWVPGAGSGGRGGPRAPGAAFRRGGPPSVSGCG